MNGSSSIRVGVIGVGVMGERHVRTYANMPSVTFAGVFDPDQSRASAVVEQFGGQVFSSADELFDHVDALTIASPTQYHSRLALSAIERQKHLLIEKPIAQHSSEAHEIVKAAKQHAGLVVNVGHIERFNPVVRALRDLIDDQPVERATFRRTTPFHGRCLDTDVIADLMIHDIDLALWFFGPASGPIRSDGAIHLTGNIDESTARYASVSKTNVTLVASRVASFKERVIELLTSDRWIVADLLTKTISTTSFDERSRTPNSSHRGQQDTLVIEGGDALRSELEHFVDCVRTGHLSPMSALAGLAASRVAESIRTNIPGLAIDPALERSTIHA